ncbi:hypothetical protein RJ640_021044 [Escallonia rubra]|uniref:Uncharacterized protein n=1 Tax=Escallonia rubra TaxID=112253 RepID=A0AA88S2P0_9ASTE|nr:hypothetical protein RJ640_021044 [Escallonia rubra]
MDVATVVCICHKLPYTEISASTEESVGNGMDIRCGAGATCTLQLAANIKAWLGLSWSSSHSQHLMVALSYWEVDVHLHHHLRWCLEWIHLAGFCRLVWLRQAFCGLSYNVVLGVLVLNDTGGDNWSFDEPFGGGWDFMIALGFNAAISVRVSNELGAGNARVAKFAVVVVSITSIAIGVVCMIIVLATRDYFPYLFTNSEAVAKETTRIAVLLGVTVLLNSLQPVLSGVAIGAGWQSKVAYINIGCYYIFGLPAGILLGFTFGLGVMGIWGGMIGGICLQTIILIVVTSLTNWEKEANEAESRVKRWGGAIANH